MENKAFVHRSFAAIAESYDLVNTLLSVGVDTWWRQEAIKALGLSGAAGLVLDCCAGTMRLGKRVLRQWPRVRVVALDFSLVMLHRGRKGMKGNAITPLCGDAEELPFRAETFDRAIIGFGIRNLTDHRQGIEELFRIIKRGGRVVILEFGRPTLPLCKDLYQWYLSRFIPWAGGVISGHNEVYRYLHTSIMAFPEPAEVMAMMHKAGFFQVRRQQLTCGIANLYMGDKMPHQ